MSNFTESEAKVLSFMEAVQNERLMKEEEDAFMNTTDYKLKQLDRCEHDGKAICLDNILCRIYKDAVPLNDDYKNACAEDLDTCFKDYIATRAPKGIEYYIKEAIRKKSPFAKRVLEAVSNLVEDEMRDKALNIEDIDTKDLVFSSNDDLTKRLEFIGDDLNSNEIAQTVRDNVKATAMSEIERAKKEKETLKNLEAELKSDIDVNNQAAVESALELKGFGPSDYIPSLFNGIMINKLNKAIPRFESGELADVYLYGAMNDFREGEVEESAEIQMASPEEYAFIEAVKEYTALSVVKALKLESFNPIMINDLAYDYASMKI